MLGRCESIKDIYINGEFDPGNIKCEKAALAEAQRIDEVVRAREENEQLLQDQMWTVSFINVRSLPHYVRKVPPNVILQTPANLPRSENCPFLTADFKYSP